MSELRIRPAGEGDIDAVLAFWAEAAEGTSVSDDRAGVANLVARDPEALLDAATRRAWTATSEHSAPGKPLVTLRDRSGAAG